MTTTTSKPTFLTVAQWKANHNVTRIDVVVNPNTGKKFASAIHPDGSTTNYNCQQAIDPVLPMRMLLPVDGDATQWCLTNVTPAADNTVFSL